MQTTSVLSAENIGKSYEGYRVVRDVSLEVHTGEVVGLLGPNGAGKTTSFYILAGLTSPDYGKVKLAGQDITRVPMYQRSRLGIGYLPQEASVFRGLSVEANIMAILEIAEPREEKREALLEELLAEFSITHLRNSSATSLSGGERRRVELARCLAAHPKIVLLDEPLAGIDPIAVSEICQLVLKLKEKGIGVLITDHNVRDALNMLDRAYILHAGTVLAMGAPQDIINNTEVRKVYLGEKFTL
jgi:lipopolysaccharide export system ATP-binding protein